MNIIDVSTSRLREYENNPRNNDLAVEKVRYSIERFGFRFPVIIDMNYTIVAGHTRVRAAKELGMMSVPCIMADDLTEEQINFFRLVDNKTSEYSDWDFEKLKTELEAINLTLESNQLLLDRFELSNEVFDIDPEQAEIKVPTFNFLEKENKPSRNGKPLVSTFVSEDPNDVIESENDAVENDDDEIEFPATEHHREPTAAAASANEDDAGISTFTAPAEDSNGAEPIVPKPAPVVSPQFRFGDVMFFISQVELDRLNEKYAEYLDSEEMLKRSFVSYLLEGVNAND